MRIIHRILSMAKLNPRVKAPIPYPGVYEYNQVPTGFVTNHKLGKSRSRIGRNGSKKQPTYYGMEIELQFDGVGNERISPKMSALADKIMKRACRNGKFVFYAKRDGSVRGLEFVTAPMTISSWNAAESKLSTFCKTCTKYGAKAGKSRDGSIHIHISKDAFITPMHLIRFIALFKQNKDYFFKISNRTEKDMNRYANMNDIVSDLILYANGHQSVISPIKHSAIRLTRSTVEVRIFKNTLLPHRILGIIQLLDILVMYTARDHPKELLDMSHVIPWATDIHKRWFKNVWRHGVALLEESAKEMKDIKCA